MAITQNFTSPVSCSIPTPTFSLAATFSCSGTGGGDGTYLNGAININNVTNGSIPTTYTLDIYIDSILRTNVEYLLTWNGTNYVMTAVDLGGTSLTAGTHVLTISLTHTTTLVVTSASFIVGVCP